MKILKKIAQTHCCKDNIVETSASWQAIWELLKCFFTNILGVKSQLYQSQGSMSFGGFGGRGKLKFSWLLVLFKEKLGGMESTLLKAVLK